MSGEYSGKREEDCDEYDDVQLVKDVLHYAHIPLRLYSERSIRRKAMRFVLNNGDVHYKKKNGTTVITYMRTKQKDHSVLY